MFTSEKSRLADGVESSHADESTRLGASADGPDGAHGRSGSVAESNKPALDGCEYRLGPV